MTSLQSAVGTLPGYIVYFGAFLLTAAQLTVLLAFFRRKQPAFWIALPHFLIGLFFLSVLLDYSYNAYIEKWTDFLYGFEERLLSVPWLLYIGAELVSAAVICFHVRSIRRYRNTHLDADAIRQALDLLPTALMVSDSDGTVLLANLKMTELCRALTGELLSDAKRFWRFIERNGDGDRLVHTQGGETWQFVKSIITLDGRQYDQVTAANMTAQYSVTEELARKNRHLKSVLNRMKAVAAKECSLAAAREAMNARITVHNRMGGVLLSGKYYLDHPENMNEEELLRMLEFNSYFLLGEAEQPERTADPIQEAIRKAKKIGVCVEISGEIPRNQTVRDLLDQAIDQCSANAVRHAGGDRLLIHMAETTDHVTAVFSNNGRAPEGPITETGGLFVLRKAVEDAGGTMTVQSQPTFLLAISVPNNLIQ